VAQEDFKLHPLRVRVAFYVLRCKIKKINKSLRKPKEERTHLKEQPELIVTLSLLFQPFLRIQQVAHIWRIPTLELCGDLEEDIANALNEK
jgi:hypothetical protein